MNCFYNFNNYKLIIKCNNRITTTIKQKSNWLKKSRNWRTPQELTSKIANTLRPSEFSKNYWKSKKCTMELTVENSRRLVNNCVKFVTSSQCTIWRRRTSTQPLTCWRSRKSFAKTTSLVKLWPTIIWHAITGELIKWEPPWISCRELWQSSRDCKDQRPRPTPTWTFARCSRS